jgi:hypothetical protein
MEWLESRVVRPRQARYQAALRPDVEHFDSTANCNRLFRDDLTVSTRSTTPTVVTSLSSRPETRGRKIPFDCCPLVSILGRSNPTDS